MSEKNSSKPNNSDKKPNNTPNGADKKPAFNL